MFKQFLDHELNYHFVRSNSDSDDPYEPLLEYVGEKPVYDTEKFIPVPVPKGW